MKAYRIDSEGKNEITIARASFHVEGGMLDVFIENGVTDDKARYEVEFQEDVIITGRFVFRSGDTRAASVHNGVLHVRIFDERQ